MKVTVYLDDHPWGELLEALADLEDRKAPQQATVLIKAGLAARQAELTERLQNRLVETAA